jgi:hypothetical protein
LPAKIKLAHKGCCGSILLAYLYSLSDFLLSKRVCAAAGRQIKNRERSPIKMQFIYFKLLSIFTNPGFVCIFIFLDKNLLLLLFFAVTKTLLEDKSEIDG